jgi:hypothetical protein
MQASASNDAATVRRLGLSAFGDLKTLEDEIRRAERPPFEQWYRKTWIRNDDSPYNFHRSYERTKAFLIERNIGFTNKAIRANSDPLYALSDQPLRSLR